MAKIIYQITIVLLIVGGLNWGLVGAANMDLVATLFGKNSVISKIIYCLVGISAIYILLLKLGIKLIR